MCFTIINMYKLHKNINFLTFLYHNIDILIVLDLYLKNCYKSRTVTLDFINI